ncbi:MAG: rhomboid family intramembrane serine protease [Candidatus Riflebacteria bacterium]|nr:rhomboid family intramembrane serine protease [Candidatus Riflebacteria bacterium]
MDEKPLFGSLRNEPGRDRIIDCPRCLKKMELVQTTCGVQVDCCRLCHGTWYDGGELSRILGKAYHYDTLLRNMELGKSSALCPVCRKEMTLLTYKRGIVSLVIDHCSSCKGFWLDRDELIVMRKIIDSIDVRASGGGLGNAFSSAKPYPPVKISKVQGKPLDPDSALAHYHAANLESNSEYEEISNGVYFFCFLSNLPVEVFNPRKRFPDGLLFIIAINFVIFFLMSQMSLEYIKRFTHNFGTIPYELLTVKGFFSLFTSQFLHADMGHIIVNMYFLWVFGDNVYDIFGDHGMIKGPVLFLCFYLLTGIIGGLLHSAFAIGSKVALIPMIGASGCVSGIIAAYWRLFPQARIYQIFFFQAYKIPISLYFLFWLGWQFIIGGTYGVNYGVAWLAHIGGFFSGYLLLPYFLPFNLEELHTRKPIYSGIR